MKIANRNNIAGVRKPGITKKHKKPVIQLNAWEHIVTAYADPASGPGWSNNTIWVIIYDSGTGKLRQECIQPSKQTGAMKDMYEFSALAHKRMTSLVNNVSGVLIED